MQYITRCAVGGVILSRGTGAKYTDMAVMTVLLLVVGVCLSPTIAEVKTATGNDLLDTSSSSEELLISRLEARIHRCVRFASPGLVVPVSSFTELAKVEVCAMEGMAMLYNGMAAEVANIHIQKCADSLTFPESVLASVNLFKSCVRRALL